MSRPWMKWYPKDWRADARLRMCSLAGRGLWIELIGYMHEAEPYGHMLIDGKAPGPAEIASLVGRPLKEVRAAMTELEERGVYSSTGAVIYSRRMVRDKAKAEQDAANGKGGGNPKLTAPDKGGVNPPLKAHIPETRNQEPERKEEPPDGGSSEYAFESGVIRLNQRDLDAWKAAFSHLDVPAELTGLSEWASKQPKWFFAVSGALAKRNREQAARLEADKAKGDKKWNGIEGVL